MFAIFLDEVFDFKRHESFSSKDSLLRRSIGFIVVFLKVLRIASWLQSRGPRTTGKFKNFGSVDSDFRFTQLSHWAIVQYNSLSIGGQ